MEIIPNIEKLPELPADALHVWGVEVPTVRRQLDRLQALLSGDEQQKAARLHREADRQSSVAARGALRVLLAAYSGLHPGELIFGYTAHGKPFLIAPPAQCRHLAAGGAAGVPPRCLAFNVSHSGNWVVLAIGRDRRIGVDIEQIRRTTDVMAIASRYFTAAEAERVAAAEDSHELFFRIWARKEAYVKACGSGLFRELSSFAVLLDDGERDGWFFRGLDAGSRYAAAVVTDRPLNNCPCYDFSRLQW